MQTEEWLSRLYEFYSSRLLGSNVQTGVTTEGTASALL